VSLQHRNSTTTPCQAHPFSEEGVLVGVLHTSYRAGVLAKLTVGVGGRVKASFSFFAISGLLSSMVTKFIPAINGAINPVTNFHAAEQYRL